VALQAEVPFRFGANLKILKNVLTLPSVMGLRPVTRETHHSFGFFFQSGHRPDWDVGPSGRSPLQIWSKSENSQKCANVTVRDGSTTRHKKDPPFVLIFFQSGHRPEWDVALQAEVPFRFGANLKILKNVLTLPSVPGLRPVTKKDPPFFLFESGRRPDSNKKKRN